MSAFLLCDRCREPITRLEEGGWQVKGEDRRDFYGHWGDWCPSEYKVIWDAIFLARFNAKVNEPLDTGPGNAELPVEAVPQSL